MELQANYDCRAEGKVLESRLDQGRGNVADIIIIIIPGTSLLSTWYFKTMGC